MAVTKRPGKRKKPWVFDYRDEMPDGKRHRHTKWFHTKGEADAAEEVWQRRKPTGRPSVDPSSTVAECAERFLKVAATKRGNTFLSYESNLRTHIVPRFGLRKMRDLDRGSLKEFLAEKMEEPVIRNGKMLRPKRSPETVRSILATGSALASFAVDEGILIANPFLRLGKTLRLTATRKARQNRVKKKAMTREQVQLFLAKAWEVVPRFYVLFLLLMRTGLRINEALALRVKDVDLNTRQLRVEHERVRNKDGRWVLGPPKSEYGVRTVRVTAQLVFELRRCLEVERAKAKLRHGWKDSPPWLFYADVDPASYDPSDEAAGTLDDGNVRRQMRRVLTALPADFPKWFTPHSGRHTFASQLLAEGKDLFYVREQLGHESIKLTADTYGSSLPSNPKNTNDCLDDPDWSEASHHIG